jgi:hypothetical protein
VSQPRGGWEYLTYLSATKVSCKGRPRVALPLSRDVTFGRGVPAGAWNCNYSSGQPVGFNVSAASRFQVLQTSRSRGGSAPLQGRSAAPRCPRREQAQRGKTASSGFHSRAGHRRVPDGRTAVSERLAAERGNGEPIGGVADDPGRGASVRVRGPNLGCLTVACGVEHFRADRADPGRCARPATSTKRER